jgi:hypothetical protein
MKAENINHIFQTHLVTKFIMQGPGPVLGLNNVILKSHLGEVKGRTTGSGEIKFIPLLPTFSKSI